MKISIAALVAAVVLVGCSDDGSGDVEGEGGARAACEHFAEGEGASGFSKPDVANNVGDRWKIEADFDGGRYYCVVELDGEDWVLSELTVK